MNTQRRTRVPSNLSNDFATFFSIPVQVMTAWFSNVIQMSDKCYILWPSVLLEVISFIFLSQAVLEVKHCLPKPNNPRPKGFHITLTISEVKF